MPSTSSIQVKNLEDSSKETKGKLAGGSTKFAESNFDPKLVLHFAIC